MANDLKIRTETFEAELYFMIKFMVAATMQATHCPITVATAAPVTPIFGAPRRPKIRIGSRMMLVMAPHSWEVMLKMVFPVDVSRRSKKNCPSRPKENIITVLRYSTPNLRISGSALCTWLE